MRVKKEKSELESSGAIITLGVYGFYKDGRDWITELKEERKNGKTIKKSSKIEI